jgi:methylase of polypeptide subunit release factors
VDLLVSSIPVDPPSVSGSRGDPRHTLVGPGAGGLDLARRLVRQSTGVLAPGGRLVLILQPWQLASMLPELETLGFVVVGTTPCKVQPREFCCLELKGGDL